MIHACEIFECWLVANACLSVAYAGFHLARRLGWQERRRHLPLARAGQFLLMLTAVLPPLLFLVPTPQLPTIPLPLHIQSDNPSFTARDRESLGTNLSPTPAAPIGGPTSINLLPPSFEELAFIWLVFWAFAGAVLLSRVLWERQRLTRLLERSLILRRQGRVRVALSDEIEVPLGTRARGQAWIVIPTTLTQPWRHLRIAISHEAQHHRQRDLGWAMASELLNLFFFPNPCFSLWRRELGELLELSCDELVLGQGRISARDYGSCLVRVAEAALRNRRLLAGTTGMATNHGGRHFKSFLTRRIEMLLWSNERKKNASYAWYLAVGLGVLVSALAYGTQQLIRGADPVNPGGLVVNDHVQAIAEKSLRRHLRELKATTGFAVVTDPSTGRVLAVAEGPRPAGTAGDGDGHWALGYRMEPASLLKTLIAARALDDGLAKVDDSFDCEKGNYRFAGQEIHDWRAFDHLTTAGLLIESSNICGLKVAQRLGMNQLEDTMKSFGIGDGGTASHFPTARSGLVVAPGRVGADTYTAILGTGYGGIHTTPLEMLEAYGAIANGGKLLAPLPATAKDVSVIRNVMTEKTSRELKEILGKVMTEGTASPSRSQLYDLAGKTATAYDPLSAGHESLGGESNVGSFIGFAPLDHPRIEVYVAIFTTSHQKIHGYNAAPVFREIAEQVLSGN